MAAFVSCCAALFGEGAVARHHCALRRELSALTISIVDDFGGGLTAVADFVCDFRAGADRLTVPPPG